MRLLALCLLPILSLPAVAGESPYVQVKLDWSNERWKGYPHSVGMPVATWSGNTLRVREIVNWGSDWSIEESKARASLQGNRVVLCYAFRAAQQPNGVRAYVQTPKPSPVMVDFTVTGIAAGNYDYEVTSNCPLR